MGICNSLLKNEVDTGYGAKIPESVSDKLYNSIVRIEIPVEEGILKGTGFFMKSQIKGKQYKFLCTNYHLVPQQLFDSKIEFSIYYGKKNKETKKIIKFDSNKRFIKYFEEPKDVCLIEIIKKDKIPEDKFLFPDLNYKNGFNVYENENFYLAGYPRVNNQFLGERHISSGKIKEIKDFEFTHTLDTRIGSSGSPICSINNQNIIGIHKVGLESEHINYATFIGVILDDLEKDDEGNKNGFDRIIEGFNDIKGNDRIIEEFNDLNRNPLFNCGITVGLMNDNDYREWKVSILGAKDTSYRGGVFYFSIKFPDDYPEKAPEVCFLTPIYHINVNPKAPKFAGDGVDSLGRVCLSTLNWWKPEYKIREFLTNIFALFYLANPNSSYGFDRAEEFRQNKTIFEEKIKFFTKKYASPRLANKVYPRNEDWDFNY